MKNFLFLFVALSIAISASAVTPEEVKASKDRIEKLKKAEKADGFGQADIKAYADKAFELKNNAVSISETLDKFYKVTAGELEEGETVVISLDECEKTYKEIEAQGKLLGDAATLAPKATAAVKNVKGMDKAKAPKSVKSTTELISTITEETAYQTKLIAEIMASIAQ